MRIAIIHDWLTSYSGAERVLEQILACYPNAEIYTIIDKVDPAQRFFLNGNRIRTSILQRLPFVSRFYRLLLPLMPFLIEQFDLRKYDLIISSSHAVAKGVLVGPDQVHICVCYTPMRYAWDLQSQYLEGGYGLKVIKNILARIMLHYLRIWDTRTANSVDVFIAISHFIERRIYKIYRRKSLVIYPPVDLSFFSLKLIKEDFYLSASRFVPYKKIALIIQAFNDMPDKRLILIGDGPDFKYCKQLAKSNIIFLGYQSAEVLRDHMQRARGFVFAAEEDFGISPVEAQACGTPVIAFGKGGALETVLGADDLNPTGVFFYEQTHTALIEAIKLFERQYSRNITPESCRANAERFSVDRFKEDFRSCVDRATKTNSFIS